VDRGGLHQSQAAEAILARLLKQPVQLVSTSRLQASSGATAWHPPKRACGHSSALVRHLLLLLLASLSLSCLFCRFSFSPSPYTPPHTGRRILLFPNGNNVQQLSVYLDVADSATLPQGWSRQAHFSLTVVNQKDSTKSVVKGASCTPRPLAAPPPPNPTLSSPRLLGGRLRRLRNPAAAPPSPQMRLVHMSRTHDGSSLAPPPPSPPVAVSAQTRITTLLCAPVTGDSASSCSCTSCASRRPALLSTTS
jgi:hypothetical protein